jgi:hypothetical protein
LETFDRDQPDFPSYIALSYTWGAPIDSDECRREYAAGEEWVLWSPLEETPIQNETGFVGMRHSKIAVGRNLFNALNRITRADLSFRYIWIDALCINQADLPERGSQVAAMAQIYSLSSRTIVWLGDTDSDTAGSVATLRTMHVLMLEAIDKYLQEVGLDAVYRVKERGRKEIYRKLGLEAYEDKFDWKVYNELYSKRTWFRRIWVVQEVALSNRCPVVMLGDSFLDWEDMALLYSYLYSTNLKTVFEDEEIPVESAVFTVKVIRHRRNIQAIDRIRTDCRKLGSDDWLNIWSSDYGISNHASAALDFFRHTIRLLRNFEATDPRDKVFATYGFLKGRDLQDVRTMVIPSYTQSVQKAYINSATVLLEQLPDLFLLSEVDDLSYGRLPDLPSWVPDWSAAGEQPLIGIFGRKIYDVSHLPGGKRYSMQRLKIDQDRLSLLGRQLDNLKTLQPTVEFAVSEHHLKEETWIVKYSMDWFASLFSLLPDITVYDSSKIEVVCRTLFANNFSLYTAGRPPLSADMLHDLVLYVIVTMELVASGFIGEGYPTEQLNSARLFIERTIFPENGLPSKETIDKWVESWRDAQRQPLDSAIWYEAADKLGELHLKASAFETAFSSFSTNSTLFSTTSGRLGLGPRSARPGDEVWLFPTARVFFVLRPMENRSWFTFIGEAYLHGCMNGELNSEESDVFERVEIR